jgi:hypothetical protein
MSLQLRIVNPAAIADVVLRCVCDNFEIPDREGRAGRGSFTNLKRILGRPADFAFVIRELARTVPAGHAVAGCDEGAWALAGAVALTLGVPAVLIPTETTRRSAGVGSPESACRPARQSA